MSEVVAFLQNQWFKNPEKVKRVYESHGDDLDRRAKLNASYLFWSSLTGRRIYSAFGETDFVRHEIIWEEITKEIGGKSSDVFPPDYQHIHRVLDHHQPKVVLTFGHVATHALMPLFAEGDDTIKIVHGPHPATRSSDVLLQLRRMNSEMLSHLGRMA